MSLLTLECARQVRDGGIDAMAALGDALAEACVGLAPPDQAELKRIFGRIMGAIAMDIIDPAWRAFPELKPDERTWADVAQARALARAGR